MLMQEKIQSALDEYKMLYGAKYVAVAFSGGADSTALLHFLYEFGKDRGFEVCAIHVNHNIRGEEAERDQRFCREFCQRLGMRIYDLIIDVPSLAAILGKSIEETAREARYKAIETIKNEHKIDVVATAHHGEDNLETVIFNLVRGTGIKGLCGIPPVRDYFIRPLIYCTKQDIVNYCELNDLEYVTDSTNNNTEYTRNYIRHEIVPKLKSLNSNLVDSISRMSTQLRGDSDYLQQKAKEISPKAARSELADLPDALLSRVIAELWAEYSGGMLESVHIRAIMNLLRKGNEYHTLSLPGGITAVFDRDEFKLRKKINKTSNHEKIYYVTEEVTDLPELGAKIIICDSKKKVSEFINIYKLSIHTAIDFGKIKGDIYIRTRKSGDKIFFRGMNRSVKKLFCDSNISCAKRDLLPVICDDNGIVWIPGFPPRDDLKTSKDAAVKYLIYIETYKGEKNDIK